MLFRVCVDVIFRPEGTAFGRSGPDRQIEFRNVKHQPRGCKISEAGLQLCLAQAVDRPVTLQSNTMDGHPFFTQPGHHLNDLPALDRIGLPIVVVKQQGLRIGFMRPSEDLFYEFFSADLHEGCTCVESSRIITDGLIQNIPGIHPSAITTCDGEDVLPEPLKQFFPGHGAAV